MTTYDSMNQPGMQRNDLIADYVDQQVPIYAGFWIRFAAYLIDAILLYVIIFFIQLATGFNAEDSFSYSDGSFHIASSFYYSTSINSIIGLLYFAIMESSNMQGTLGKKAVAIKVVEMQGQRISFLRALGRNLGKYLSAIILLIGYIMAGFTEKKQALHDMMAGALVVSK